ncbi:hypothetical protein ACMGE6_05795 [Macrococcus equi]|uniref:hypothetical protein n=1 Tax=Macrococcus equi TaxID=3395462 RepID=UPI0039BDC6C0
MYLLKFVSSNNIQNIGLFDTEEQLIAWVEAIPFVTKHDDYDYEIKHDAFPAYYEHQHNGSIYPLTNLSHEDDVEILWEEIPVMHQQGMIDGTTLIDNYYFDHQSLKTSIEARDALRKEIIEYCQAQNIEYTEGGFGSEDGAYISSPERFFIHLDPSTIEARKNYDSIEQFIEA